MIITIVTVLVISVIAAFLLIANLEKKTSTEYLNDCQISKEYFCWNWLACKGNPIGCKQAVKKE